jgi:hypothetical protein
MTTQILTCRKCGISDSIDVIEKSGHHIAYCARCNAYIKHLPTQEPQFYFGKYKGCKIAEVEDIQYLQWALKALKLGASVRVAITTRIKTLSLIQR